MAQPLSPSLPRSVRFLRPPLSAAPLAFLTVRFPLLGELRTFHVPLVCLDGLGSACSPVMFLSPMEEAGYPHAHHFTCWFKPISTFGLFVVTTFIGSLHMLAIPSNSSTPTTLMLVVLTFPHGSMILYRRVTLFRKLPTPELLRARVSVEYWWENTRLSPVIQSQQPRKRLHVATS